jgi:hypothetical protein
MFVKAGTKFFAKEALFAARLEVEAGQHDR